MQDVQELSKHHNEVEFLGIGRPNKPPHRKYEAGEKAAAGSTPRLRYSKSQILKSGTHFCCYCEEELDHDTFTKDHLQPICRGGLNTIKNLRPCCYNCNQEKGGLMLHSYIQLLNLKLLDYKGELLEKLQIKIRNANRLAMEISQ